MKPEFSRRPAFTDFERPVANDGGPRVESDSRRVRPGSWRFGVLNHEKTFAFKHLKSFLLRFIPRLSL